MFPARRFLRTLNTNPVAQSELAYLRAHTRGLLHWRYASLHLLFIMATFAALMPLWLYINIGYTRLLASIGVLVFAVQLVVCLRTALIAAHTLSREFPPVRWSALASSEYNARQIVLGKWWAAVRVTWRPHLFLAVLRAGLALGIAQHEYSAAYYRTGTLRIYALFYKLETTPNLVSSCAQPAFAEILSICLLVTFFSLTGVGLAAALGLGGALIARLRRVNVRWFVVTLYGLILGMVLIVAHLLDARSRAVLSHYPYYYPRSEHELEIFRLRESIFTLSLPFDGGIGAATDMLRPDALTPLSVLRGIAPLTSGTIVWGGVMALSLYLITRLAVQDGLQPAPTHAIDWTARWRRWRTNPLLRDPGLLCFQSSPAGRWSNVSVLVLFAVALYTVTYPRWHQLRCYEGQIVLWMAIIVGAFQVLIILRTLFLAAHVMHRTANHDGWDTLALTRIDTRRIIIGKWRVVFASVWPFHLLVAALKLPFMHSLVSYLNDTSISWSFTALEQAFLHISGNWIGSGCLSYYAGQRTGFYSYFPSIFSSWVIILTVFALLEAAFLIMLGFISALLIRKHIALQIAAGLLLRALPIVPVLIVWMPLNNQTRQQHVYAEGKQRCSGGYCESNARDLYRIWDTFRVALSTPLDGGVTAVNLSAFAYSKPYRLRQQTGYGLGFGSYVLLTLLALRAAERLLIRRGALPPNKVPT